MADGNREIINRYLRAMQARDWASLRGLVRADIVVEWPQTRERIRGVENMDAIDANYPGGMPQATPRRVLGSEDRWVVDPFFIPRRIAGSGDVWCAEADLRYADGSEWAYCAVIELRDGKVAHMTEYFAPRSEAPAWRSRWVEALPDER